jgi:hypothetical protein
MTEAERQARNERDRLRYKDEPDYAAKRRTGSAKYRSTRREGINAGRRERYRQDPACAERARVQTHEWRKRNPGLNAEKCRQRADRLRREICEAYGGKCSCCEETERVFLTIDHIENDGAVDRNKMGGRSGVHLYHMLRKLRYPKDRYRLMCFNCNLGRARNGGVCPHKNGKGP